MNYLNYEFFEEFKALDNLCRDIYGESVNNKLGVTLYLEDMKMQEYQGGLSVPGWMSDYNRLKNARNIRNDIAHSRTSYSFDICTEDDIEFVRTFRSRILNQRDPISLLRQRYAHSYPAKDYEPIYEPKPIYTPQKPSLGCLGILLIAVAFIIAF